MTTPQAPQADQALEALRLILPLAKGYAAAHPVGSNAEYVLHAEAALAASPQAEPAPTRLSDERIMKMWDTRKKFLDGWGQVDIIAFSRAIEAALAAPVLAPNRALMEHVLADMQRARSLIADDSGPGYFLYKAISSMLQLIQEAT